MLKNATYKEKFVMLKEWLPALLDSIKRDLKNDHVKQDYIFYKKYFSNLNPQKLTAEDLANGYGRAIAEEEKSEEIGDFICNRWLLKHADMYEFFESKLNKITEDFTKLETLDLKQSEELINESIEQFGPTNTYFFSVLNSVVFPKEAFDKLALKVREAAEQNQIKEESLAEERNINNIRQGYELQISRLSEKYEKRLSGLEKKYIQDTESLKKQVASLQRKLNG